MNNLFVSLSNTYDHVGFDLNVYFTFIDLINFTNNY